MSKSEDSVLNDKFIFVSYSHANQKTVEEDVILLRNMGVRLWYDESMESGEHWNHVAESMIKHPNCVGVIFYNSVQALLSAPIDKERRWAIERWNGEQKGDPNYYQCVNMQGKSSNELIRDTYLFLSSSNTLDALLPLSTLSLFIDMFASSLLYVAHSENNKDYLQKLYKFAEKKKAVSFSLLLMRELYGKGKAIMQNGDYMFVLGEYKGEQTAGIPGILPTTKGWRDFGGRKYYICGGKAYISKKLTWNLLSSDNGKVSFISNGLIDKKTSGEGLMKWLNEEFFSDAFSSDEKELFCEPVRLCSSAELVSASDSVKRLEGTPCNWWLMKNGGPPATQNVANGNGIEIGQLLMNAPAGVRAVITLSIDKIKEKYNLNY